MNDSISVAEKSFMLKLFLKNDQIRSVLQFIRLHNLKEKLLSETSWYLASNLIYSASTYMVGLLIPYVLNTNYMAYFTAGNQALLLLAFIFEFGLSISFLRYYRIDRSTKYINSILQFSLFGLLIIVGYFFSGPINNLFNLEDVPLDSRVLYLLVISQLSWLFIKNWMLAAGQNKMQVVHSLIVLFLRIVFIYHLYHVKTVTITQLFLETLLYPFIPAILHLLFVNTKIIVQAIPALIELKTKALSIFFTKTKEYLSYSLLTYFAGFLYLYTGRYFIIYLSGRNHVALADVGYSMTFIGVILVFYASFRNYLISKLSKDRLDFINSYILNMKKLNKYFLIGSFLVSLFFSYLVFIIKPHYLTFDAVLFAFVLFFTRISVFYLGLFTVLSKTMNYNRLEVGLNVIRLAVVIGITHLLMCRNVLVAFILINAFDLITEIIYSKIILRRIAYATQLQAV
ncbi:MAG: hypothetical protein NTX22_05385 [Ignavibacteriales bacterium]|nr:hypothetical protein [Ignavibacteriales bacterium]